MKFYREIFQDAPDKIVVPDYLLNREIEVIILPLSSKKEISENADQPTNELTKNPTRNVEES